MGCVWLYDFGEGNHRGLVDGPEVEGVGAFVDDGCGVGGYELGLGEGEGGGYDG